jgi:hypothetical protein
MGPDFVEGKPKKPQSWNRYIYGFDNPVGYVDPDGQDGLSFVDVAGATYDALARTTDEIAFGFAYPYFKIQEGILNDDPVELGKGVAMIVADAVGGVAVDTLVGARTVALTRELGVAREAIAGFETKVAAREAVSKLGLGEAQGSAVNRAISRATRSERIVIGVSDNGDVAVRLVRTGHDGYQVVETTVSRDGAKRVVQKAYDASGKRVHYHPK